MNKRVIHGLVATIALLSAMPAMAQSIVATDQSTDGPGQGAIKPSIPVSPAAPAPAATASHTVAAQPVAAPVAQSPAIEARLSAIEARLAALESAKASGQPVTASAVQAATPPTDQAPGAPKAVKLSPAFIVGVHPIDKDLAIQPVEIGNFRGTGFSWPMKMNAHDSYGVHYSQPVAYVIAGYLKAPSTGKYILGVQIERNQIGSGECHVSISVEGRQVADGTTGKFYAKSVGQQPFQGLSQLDLEAGAYNVEYRIACNDQGFEWTLLARTPDDHAPRGLRPDEMQHDAAIDKPAGKKG